MAELTPEEEILLYERLERLRGELALIVQDGSPASYEWAVLRGWYRGWHEGFDAAERIAREGFAEAAAVNVETAHTLTRLATANRQLSQAATFWVCVSGSLVLGLLGVWWWRS